MAYIKNISHEEVLHLADQVSADKGQIVSKTLAQNDHVSVTLFAFPKMKKSLHMILLVMQWFSFLKESVSSLLMAKNIFYRQGIPSLCQRKNLILFTQKKTLSGFSLLYFLHNRIYKNVLLKSFQFDFMKLFFVSFT